MGTFAVDAEGHRRTPFGRVEGVVFSAGGTDFVRHLGAAGRGHMAIVPALVALERARRVVENRKTHAVEEDFSRDLLLRETKYIGICPST